MSQFIYGILKAEIQKVAEEIFLALTGKYPNLKPKCEGGVLAIRDTRTGEILLESYIGCINDPEKARKYTELAREKTQRISKNISISSFQTRDLNNKKYGGGILALEGWQLAIAFSGHTEHGDEAICLSLGLEFGFVNLQRCNDIIKISQNEIGSEIIQQYAA